MLPARAPAALAVAAQVDPILAVLALAGLAGVALALAGFARVARRLAERRWRDAADALGLDLESGATRATPLALRGEVAGRRVEAAWSPRGRGGPGTRAGLRLTVHHTDLRRGLSVPGSKALARMLARPEHAATLRSSDRATLERLFAALPAALVDDTGVRLARRRDDLTAAEMVDAVRAMVRASRELSGEPDYSAMSESM